MEQSKERPGRPRRLINARQCHVTLEDWQWQALEGQAVRGQITVSALLRQIVTEHLEQFELLAGRTAEEG